MTPLEVLGPLLDLPELADLDPWADRDLIKERLDPVFARETTGSWLEFLLPKGIWCAQARTTMQAVDELRREGSELICEVEHPVAGKLELIGCPITLSETPWRLRFPPPLVGEHTEEVFRPVLKPDELQALLEPGARP
jgi:crotonobetainyl-CoA:carnitine CoA-transferase CaiB-like acyl-CoA transferase